MKRFLSCVLLVLLAGLSAGCGKSEKTAPGDNKDKDKPQAQKDAEK